MKNKKKGIAIAIAMACVVVFLIVAANMTTAESVQSSFWVVSARQVWKAAFSRPPGRLKRGLAAKPPRYFDRP